MRKLAMATAAAAFGAMLAAPAMAQDGPFAGGRVEALAGYDNVQDGGDGSSEAPAASPTAASSATISSAATPCSAWKAN